jgi:transposase-like protein
MAKEVYKRYSEAFRIQVVREYEESGVSLNALRKKYGVSIKALELWINRYSKEGVRHRLMVIQSPEEQNRIKELEERIRRQEELIARLALDKLMLESTLEVIERDYGIDVKKNASTSSKQPTKRKRRPK